MARFYRIQIGSIHIASDGLETGIKCKLDVPDASDLIDDFAQNAIVGNNGSVIVQNFERTGGQFFSINIEVLPKSVWESLKTLRTNALQNETLIRVQGIGDIGNFDVNANPLKFNAFDFNNSRIKNIVLNFVKKNNYQE